MRKIRIRFNEPDFEYDVHSLAKAFYPDDEVIVRGKEQTDAADLEIRIDYLADQVVIRVGDRERSSDCPGTLERKQKKNIVKLLLYDLLSEKTGQELPWGTLSGIRPVKIPMKMIEQGKSNAQAAAYMRETYRTTPEKTALAVVIANRERAILEPIDYEHGYSLYIGIPFCPSICLYCSFSSSPLALWKNEVDAYLDALFKEIEFVADRYRDRTLQAVYFGGGTPTTLTGAQLERVLGKVIRCFSMDSVREFTVEAGRPDSITPEKLAVMRQYGVSRISVNPQTMNQETLDLIGRKHTVQDTVRAFHEARDAGFHNINMDLIAGLPGEDERSMAHTLSEIEKLSPDSLTIHSLAIKRASRLHEQIEQWQKQRLVNSQSIMDLVADSAMRMQMHPYYLYRQKNMKGNLENIGYATEGCDGLYNVLIMEEKQNIIAVGAGASTKLIYDGGERIERVENVKDVRQYLSRIDEMIERKKKQL